MSKVKNDINAEPAKTQALSVYKVSYQYVPVSFIEAWNEQDAAAKYRDRYDLSPFRDVKVEKTNGSD